MNLIENVLLFLAVVFIARGDKLAKELGGQDILAVIIVVTGALLLCIYGNIRH